MAEDTVGTIVIASSLKDHDRVVKFAKESKWHLVGLVENKTTYLTQSGQLVQIQIAHIEEV